MLSLTEKDSVHSAKPEPFLTPSPCNLQILPLIKPKPKPYYFVFKVNL
jgi:hypothetical protein